MKYQKKDGVPEQLELLKRRGKEIPDTERLQTLQEKLYQKAKQEPGYRFYVLYDKTFIPYILREAWNQVRANNSAPGVDGKTVEDVESYGVEKFLQELGEELRKQSYRPQPIKRIYITKPNGKLRPIGIGCIKDRIAQTVCKLIIEPIFEADFADNSYGFRPGRSSEGAMKEIKENLKSGKTEIYDADLSSYFDTIPHNKLYIVLKQRIADPRMMRLIDKFLKAPIKDNEGLKGGKSNKIGVPQGGVISPLLANIYMNLIDKAVNKETGIFSLNGIKIVRFADDFVLMGKDLKEKVIKYLQSLIQQMDLTINEDKTKIVKATDEPFNFLGFTIRNDKDIHGRGCHYWNIIPSKKAVNKIVENIRETLHSSLHYSPDKLVVSLNEKLRGWLNYYDIPGTSYPACSKRAIRYYLNTSLYRYYNRKSQRKSSMYRQHAFEILVKKYGLVDPIKYKPSTT
jgi:group II intron reverse transcriptase/maturase